MRLIIDVGNTNIKLAVFKNNSICESFIKHTFSKQIIKNIMTTYPSIDIVFLCATNPKNKIGKSIFIDYKVRFFDFNNINVLIPSSYNGPLGEDRIALSKAGMFFYGNNVLIIDLGTCITYDLIFEGKHEGGQISLGLQARLNSLCKSTETLPRVDFVKPRFFIGKSTEDCILSGVFFGILSEIELMIQRYTKGRKLDIIITGGDSKYFQKHMKNVIFDDNLLMKGLNCILNENITN